MTDNFSMNVPADFDFGFFSDLLTASMQEDGYSFSTVDLLDMKKIKFTKNTSGIKKILGMGESITATCSVNNGVLNIKYSNIDWTLTIVALVIGIFLFVGILGIPFLVGGIIGAVRKIGIADKISDKAGVYAARSVTPQV